MYRVTVSCGGIDEGPATGACGDIVEEFSHRPWHHNVTYHWVTLRLRLVAENDYDSDGLALLDEFRDAVVGAGYLTR
jgi:hypothetical protein